MDCLVKSSQLIAVKIISNADAEVETFVATADVLRFSEMFQKDVWNLIIEFHTSLKGICKWLHPWDAKSPHLLKKLA